MIIKENMNHVLEIFFKIGGGKSIVLQERAFFGSRTFSRLPFFPVSRILETAEWTRKTAPGTLL